MSGLNGKTADELKAHVIKVLGNAYILAGVVDLRTLGIDDMPLNATGKVQKLDLQGPLEAWIKNGSH